MTQIKCGIDAKEYDRIHKWMAYHYGKATHCENKDCNGVSKNYVWAMIHEKGYAQNREHFKMLCMRCHTFEDRKEDTLAKLSKSLTGYKQTPEHIAKRVAGVQAASWKGKKSSEWTPERRAAMSKAMKGNENYKGGTNFKK